MSDRSYAVANAAHSLRRTIQDAEEKLALLSKIPARDDFPADMVIRVVARPRYGNTDTVLTYAFLKIVEPEPRGGQKWYVTGTLSGRGHNNERWLRWDQLVSWLVNDVVLDRLELMAPTTEPQRDDAQIAQLLSDGMRLMQSYDIEVGARWMEAAARMIAVLTPVTEDQAAEWQATAS